MDAMEKSDIIAYIIIPVLIFLARILDVSVGTIRIILISRGNKFISPLLGFIEVTIWLLAISQIMKNLNNVVCYLAYGSGFAFGNYVGILLENKLALGLQGIRIITNNQLQSLPMVLRDEGFAVTTIKGRGSKGPVNVIHTVVNRKDVNQVLEITKHLEPQAFVMVEDVRYAQAGYFKPKVPFRVAKKK